MHASLRLQSEQKLLVYMRTQKAQVVYKGYKKRIILFNFVQLRKQVLLKCFRIYFDIFWRVPPMILWEVYFFSCFMNIFIEHLLGIRLRSRLLLSWRFHFISFEFYSVFLLVKHQEFSLAKVAEFSDSCLELMSEPSFSVAILYLVHEFPLWTVIHLFIKTLAFLKIEASSLSKNPWVAFYTKDIIQIAFISHTFKYILLGELLPVA